MTKFWITFNLQNKSGTQDVVGACIEGDKATVHWNGASWEKTLNESWEYREVKNLPPHDIQRGVMQVAFGAPISNLRITDEDINWDEQWQKMR